MYSKIVNICKKYTKLLFYNVMPINITKKHDEMSTLYEAEFREFA